MAAKEIRQFAWKIDTNGKVDRVPCAKTARRVGKKQIATNLFITKGATTTATTTQWLWPFKCINKLTAQLKRFFPCLSRRSTNKFDLPTVSVDQSQLKRI